MLCAIICWAHTLLALTGLVDKSLPVTPAEAPAAPKTEVAAPNGSPPKQPRKSGAEEKKELMEKMQPSKGSRPVDMGKQKGDHWEKDPTTGLDVLIRDAQFKGTLVQVVRYTCISKLLQTFARKGLTMQPSIPTIPKPAPRFVDPQTRRRRTPATLHLRPLNPAISAFSRFHHPSTQSTSRKQRTYSEPALS